MKLYYKDVILYCAFGLTVVKNCDLIVGYYFKKNFMSDYNADFISYLKLAT